MGAAVGLRRFTRTEMFVGLVVIGLAVGGVFKAQAMVIDAKVSRIQNDYRDLSAAVRAYQDRYHVLPGDDPAAATRFPGFWTVADNGDGDGLIQGAWNSTDNAHESRKIWKHLRGAGFIDGPADESPASYAPPAHAIGGPVGFAQGLYNLAEPVIVFGALPGDLNQVIESRTDDGSPASGTIQGNAQVASYDAEASYDLAFRL